MHYLLGKTEKTQKKIDNGIVDVFKAKIKNQFCEVCGKNPATKVAFGKEVKPVFTCSTCQLSAVGGSVQRLGPKNLISTDKFCESLAKQLISYQSSQKNQPAENKKACETCASLKNKVNQLNQQITEEYKKMKVTIKQKHEEVLNDSLKQNTVFIFEEVNKLVKEKKLNDIDNGRIILKRSMCNQKGIRFFDEEGIENANEAINEKFSTIRKQSKIKLKPLEDLIEEINAIEL